MTAVDLSKPGEPGREDLDRDLDRALLEEPALPAPFALPRVNLLPPEIEERRRFQQIQVGLGGAVVAAVGVVGLLYVSALGSVGAARTELDDATATGDRLTGEASSYRDVTAVYEQAASAQQTLTQAMGQEVRWSRYLNDLSFTVPDTVWVRSASFSQATPTTPASGTSSATPIGTVQFEGTGFGHDDVAVWLESLAGQKGYADPTFSNSTEAMIGPRKVVTFTSTATLTSDALSGRYTTPDGG